MQPSIPASTRLCEKILLRHGSNTIRSTLAFRHYYSTAPSNIHVLRGACLPLALRRPPTSRRITSAATVSASATTDITPPPGTSSRPAAPFTDVPAGTYAGPLTNTFRRLKLFSLSSLTLSFALAPFMFVIESNLPVAARFALAGTALATSGASTALVAWSGRPYVTRLARLPDGGGVQLTTLSLGLHERHTRVYDTSFLVDTKRPFAKWELAEQLTVAPAPGLPLPTSGTEETIAETFDGRSGAVVGRWIVQWKENGIGECRESGKVIRHFNVHEELLDGPIRPT